MESKQRRFNMESKQRRFNMIKYLNLKTQYGVETVDELSLKDFKTFFEFQKELTRLITEYHLAGVNVYVSSRCDKTWNQK